MSTRREYEIEMAKLRSARKALKQGGDNFRWIGYGKVQFLFRGRPDSRRKGKTWFDADSLAQEM